MQTCHLQVTILGLKDHALIAKLWLQSQGLLPSKCKADQGPQHVVWALASFREINLAK